MNHLFIWQSFAGLLGFLLTLPLAIAQQPPATGIGPDNQVNQQGQGLPGGLEGGAAQADFDSLIDLISSTVQPETWAENGTGAGEIQAFPTGVYADAEGTLRFAKTPTTMVSLSLLAKQPNNQHDQNVRHRSELRYVSLPRLEAAIRTRQQLHEALPVEMLTLAGLQRVEYVFVTPKTDDQPGDIVVAGPAGDWQVQADGTIVSRETGQPIVRLDDLLTLWRRQQQFQGSPFGVAINPRREGLARVQKYLRRSSLKPIKASQRDEWVQGLKTCLGKQDVSFFGIDPSSHVANVLLIADYHMKLIGMGLADSVDGVTNYLDTVKLDSLDKAPPTTVLRWWFAMQYDPVATTTDRDVYQLRGPGAKVLSENELLAERGKRIHTGKSNDLNKLYADSFSEHFEAICQKYPLYTELRNALDLSLILKLIEKEELLDRAGWQPTLFANSSLLPLPKTQIPTEVETVVNHRLIRRKHIIAGVSGGVWVDTGKTLVIESSTGITANVKAAPKTGEDKAIEGEAVWWWD